MEMPSRPPGSGPAAQVAVTRILIDCSLIRFDGRMTGIPRVVLKYVRYGRAFGVRKNISVVPVEFTVEGHLCERKLPDEMFEGDGPPLTPRLPVPLKVLLELMRYGVSVIVAAANFIAATVPIRPFVRAARSIALNLPVLITWTRQRWTGPSSRVFIEPSAGDVLFCPNYWHDIESSIYAAMRARGVEILFLIHDILPVTSPAYYAYPWRWQFERRLAQSLDFVSHYYCVSNKTLSDLTEFAALRNKTIHGSVAYNGFERPAVPDPLGKPSTGAVRGAFAGLPPWLMVGTLEPKKGYRTALAAFDALWSAGYRRPLLIVGHRGWMCDDIIETIEASPRLGERLFVLETVGDEELARFYGLAHALLFGSFAEGFGLPLLEAASHGLPIVARDIPTSREILLSQGRYFKTTEELCEAIKDLEDATTYHAARASLEQLNWFAWHSVVECVMTDIIRRPHDRRLGTNLLDPNLLEPAGRAAESILAQAATGAPSIEGEFL